MSSGTLKIVAMYLIAFALGVLINVGIWGYLLRSYVGQQAETREQLEAIHTALTKIDDHLKFNQVRTSLPVTESSYVQGSCYGACNRPIDESQIRIAPTKETRGELAEMLDRQTRDISRAVDEKTQAIQKMMWSTR